MLQSCEFLYNSIMSTKIPGVSRRRKSKLASRSPRYPILKQFQIMVLGIVENRRVNVEFIVIYHFVTLPSALPPEAVEVTAVYGQVSGSNDNI